MIRLIREIARDSVQVARMEFKHFRLTGGGGEAARKLHEAEQILQDAKDKAREEEAVLVEIRAFALNGLAAVQTKALEGGAAQQAGEMTDDDKSTKIKD